MILLFECSVSKMLNLLRQPEEQIADGVDEVEVICPIGHRRLSRRSPFCPRSGRFGVKNFSGQGAIRRHDGFQKNFRLFPGNSWNAEETLLKHAAGVKKDL